MLASSARSTLLHQNSSLCVRFAANGVKPEHARYACLRLCEADLQHIAASICSPLLALICQMDLGWTALLAALLLVAHERSDPTDLLKQAQLHAL